MTDTPEAVRLADDLALQCFPGNKSIYDAIALLRRFPELEAEVQEQARLNGMGAERELALRAQVSRLEAERDQLREAIKKQSNAIALFQKSATENARHFADANLRREADLSTAEAKSVAEANAILTAENDNLRAELEKVRVPDGWRLVPVEPTQEMLDAVVTTMDEAVHGKNADLVYREGWASMLAAAPATATALTDDDLFWLAAEHASSSGANSGSVSPYFIFEVNDLRNFIRATFTAPTPPHADQKGQ